jgi:vitamin B12 transporter
VSPVLGGVALASVTGRMSEKGIPGSMTYASPNSSQKEYDARGVLGWGTDAIAGGNVSIETDLSATWSRLNYVDPDGWPSGTDDTHDSSGIAADVRSELVAGPAIVRVGLSGGADATESTAIGEKSRLFIGAYDAPEFAFGWLVFAPSLRYDLYSDYEAGLSYGLGTSWRKAGFTLRANGTSAYKAPSFNDLYWPDDGFTVSNADLESERGWSAEFGAEYSNGAFTISAYPFFRYVQNMIAWSYSMETFMYSPANIDTAAYAVADLSATGAWGLVSASVSYSFTLAKNLAGDAGFQAADRLAFVPLHAVKVEAGIEAGIARVTVDAAYDAGRLDADAEALPALLLLGAKVELEALSGCFVGLSLDNVLDEAYFEYSGYPMPGLSATASLRWDL